MNNLLPPHWAKVKVKDIALRIHYGYTASAVISNTGTKMLRITDIQDNKVNWGDVPFCNIDSQDVPKYLLQEGDIVFARTGATVGKSFLIPGAVPQAVFASYLIRIKVSQYVNPKYLFYFFQSLDYWKQIGAKAIGIGQPNVNASSLSNITLGLCPPNEQNQIVLKLDELFSALDKAKEQLKEVLQQIDVYKYSVINDAYSGNSNYSYFYENAKKYTPVYKTINEICSIVGDGLHGTPIYVEDSEYFFINGNNLKDGKIDIKSNTKTVAQSEFEKYKKPLGENTILLSINGTIGNTAFYNNEKVILGKSACYLNLKDKINKHYVRYYLTSIEFKSFVKKVAIGSVIKNLNLKDVREFKIPFPPTVEDQDNTVLEIERLFSICSTLNDTVKSHLIAVDNLKSSILADAFTGKLICNNEYEGLVGTFLDQIFEERETNAQAFNEAKKSKSPQKKVLKMAEELKDILEVLKESNEPIATKNLWLSSSYKSDIDEFYAQLKKHIEHGEVVEIQRNGKNSYIKLSSTYED